MRDLTHSGLHYQQFGLVPRRFCVVLPYHRFKGTAVGTGNMNHRDFIGGSTGASDMTCPYILAEIVMVGQDFTQAFASHSVRPVRAIIRPARALGMNHVLLRGICWRAAFIAVNSSIVTARKTSAAVARPASTSLSR